MDELGRTIIAAATRGVENATSGDNWRRATKADRADIRDQVVELLLLEHKKGSWPDDPIAWATRVASRAFGERHRREKASANLSAATPDGDTEDRLTARVEVRRKTAGMGKEKLAETVRRASEPRGRPKTARPTDRATLRAAVLETCARQFEAFAKKQWDHKRAKRLKLGLLRRRRAYIAEREAQRAFERVRALAQEVARLPTQAPFMGANAGNLIREVIVPAFGSLQAHPAITDPEFRFTPPPSENLMSMFVSMWDSRDMLPIGRYLTDRELAIVALLGGCWPPSARIGDTVTQVQAKMEDTVRATRADHGRLKTAIDKAVAGAGRMPRGARYVMWITTTPMISWPEMHEMKRTTESVSFASIDAAQRRVEEIVPGAHAVEMQVGRWWDIRRGDRCFGMIELRDTSERKKKSGVRKE